MSKDNESILASLVGTHDQFYRRGEACIIPTSVFEGVVTVSREDDVRYAVEVTVPTLDAATLDSVSPVVEDDWFETFRRRLADADAPVRQPVEVCTIDVTRAGTSVNIIIAYRSSRPEDAAAIAKTLVEFVEGTYVEGIIPGYEYTEPVTELLASASQSGDRGTPL